MSESIARLLALLAAGMPVVRMVVAAVQGSAPREPGASLLYWSDGGGHLHSFGSVGGGQLEARSMQIAQFLLDSPTGAMAGAARPARARRRVERFTLGASLGQCCGGVVQMYWERFDNLSDAQPLLGQATRAGACERLRYCALDGSERQWVLGADQVDAQGLPRAAFEGNAGLLKSAGCAFFVERLADEATALWLYGAGHVGRALVRALADLPFRIHWIDNRVDMVAQAMAELPAGRREQLTGCADDPEAACATAPGDAWHVVMTHCHDLDLQICESLLAVGQFGFLGLIGSKTKAARFRHRLCAKGYRPDLIDRLVCPIGIDGIHDKRPAAIAIAVAGQLLQQRACAGRQSAPASAGGPAGLARHD